MKTRCASLAVSGTVKQDPVVLVMTPLMHRVITPDGWKEPGFH